LTFCIGRFSGVDGIDSTVMLLLVVFGDPEADEIKILYGGGCITFVAFPTLLLAIEGEPEFVGLLKLTTMVGGEVAMAIWYVGGGWALTASS
jgi:hypothetical protein